MEYFDSAKSKETEPYYRTTALRDPARNSSTTFASDSAVIVGMFAAAIRSVCDG
jgi:hypothetical protein